MEERINIKVISLIILGMFCINSVNATRQTARPKIVSSVFPQSRELKKALGYFEDSYLTFRELTAKYGYPSETHQVTTEDGYILTVFRVLSKCEGPRRLYPVLLSHGLYDSSDAWILPDPQKGLAYILSHQCYDVWATNHRGNNYSRQHRWLDPNRDPEYWEFSFDEHGYYDVPAVVDYILRTANVSKVNYIGHSEGTTDFFVMTSLRPEYNSKIQVSIHLAPITWMRNLDTSLAKIVAQNTNDIKKALDVAGFREVFAKQQLPHALIEFLCQIAPAQVCGTALAASTGYKQGNIKPETLAIAFGHLLVGTSSKNMAHLGQLINSGKFQRYDEGNVKNIIKYGVPKPPEYDVTKTTSAVVLVSAQNDQVSTLKDVAILASKLPNLIENYVVPDPSWSHSDHLWGFNASKYVFPKIIEHLNRLTTLI